MTGERVRGRRGVALRRRRLDAEPLCRMCKAEGRVTVATVPDHIVPLSKGGKDVDSNVQCLCGPCHDRKTAIDLGHKQRLPIRADGWPA